MRGAYLLITTLEDRRERALRGCAELVRFFDPCVFVKQRRTNELEMTGFTDPIATGGRREPCRPVERFQALDHRF